MDQKQIVTFEFELNDRKFQFLMPRDTNLGEAYDAAYLVLAHISKLSNEAVARAEENVQKVKAEAAAKAKEEAPKKVEKKTE